jgi:DNA-binding LacI/PurR family transcriptional regulator
MSRKREGVRLPASERLATALLERIERGDYPPGTWLPTERELAAEFHADRSTIRTALSSLADRQLIVRETGRRPRVAWVERGPSVDTGGMTRSQTIAVLSPQTPHYPAAPAIQRGALHVLNAKEAPYRLLVFDNHAQTVSETVRRERQALSAIVDEGVSGVVLWHQGNVDTVPDICRVQHAGIPIVLVDRRYPTLDCDFVGIDNVEAAREAVTYLLDLGHHRIGHLTVDDPTSTVADREQGFREAMQSRGISDEQQLIYRMPMVNRLQPSVTEAVDYFLSMSNPPSAVFVMNDPLAHALMAEFQARGVSVPDQISVMGFDDMDRGSPRPSPLSTVHQPFELMGQRAVELLLSRLVEPARAHPAYRHVLLPTRLILRSSCRPYSR